MKCQLRSHDNLHQIHLKEQVSWPSKCAVNNSKDVQVQVLEPQMEPLKGEFDMLFYMLPLFLEWLAMC